MSQGQPEVGKTLGLPPAHYSDRAREPRHVHSPTHVPCLLDSPKYVKAFFLGRPHAQYGTQIHNNPESKSHMLY